MVAWTSSAGKLYDGTMRVGFVVLHKRDLWLAKGTSLMHQFPNLLLRDCFAAYGACSDVRFRTRGKKPVTVFARLLMEAFMCQVFFNPVRLSYFWVGCSCLRSSS